LKKDQKFLSTSITILLPENFFKMKNYQELFDNFLIYIPLTYIGKNKVVLSTNDNLKSKVQESRS
jgi:hypothetical protein